MRRLFFILACLLALSTFLPSSVKAQSTNNLSIKTRIDSTFVFAFDLTESRSAKGGIWNLKTGEAVTPLNYTEAKTDTIDGKPVVKLYRQVALGNHPLNGWETWAKKCCCKWERFDEAMDRKEKSPKRPNDTSSF